MVAETTLLGLAFGLAFAAMSNLVVDAVPQSQTGVASGMNANIRTVGGALGGAVLASVVTAGARPDGLPVEAGYAHGFGVLVVTSALAALVALFVPVVRARTHVVPGPRSEAEAELAAQHEARAPARARVRRSPNRSAAEPPGCGSALVGDPLRLAQRALEARAGASTSTRTVVPDVVLDVLGQPAARAPPGRPRRPTRAPRPAR